MGIGRPQKEKKHEGTNFAQIVCMELKKALHKHMHKSKKRHGNDSDSDSDFNENSRRRGSDSTGKLIICKKRKLNNSFKSYTYPSQNKAIPNSKFDVSNECNIDTKNKSKLEKSCSKIKNWN